MACFLVPAAEAVVTTVATKIVESKETKTEEKVETASSIPVSKKMKWLSNLLWGGSGLLAFEHVWHGEVVPFFPFLTNASNPADAAEMVHEMSTVGVTMAVLVTIVWVGMVLVSSKIEKMDVPELRNMKKGV